MSRLTMIGVPERLAEPIERADELEETPALQAARSMVREGTRLCVLAGNVGTGKSLAAVWALDWWHNASAKRNPWGRLEFYDGRCWVTAQVFSRLQPWDPLFAEFERAPMLVVDDMGEENPTEKIEALINGLLTTRFAMGSTTIVTTNLDGKSFKDRYGDRIIDRLRECGLNDEGKAKWWVRCAGDSLRGHTEPKPRPRPPEPPDSGARWAKVEMTMQEMGQVSNEVAERIEQDEPMQDIVDRLAHRKRLEPIT